MFQGSRLHAIPSIHALGSVGTSAVSLSRSMTKSDAMNEQSFNPQPTALKLRYSNVSEFHSMFSLAFRTRTPR
jgi:hypothetical protein